MTFALVPHTNLSPSSRNKALLLFPATFKVSLTNQRVGLRPWASGASVVWEVGWLDGDV